MDKQSKFKSFFSDKRGRIVIGQWPNVPLIVWLVSLALSKITSGAWKTVFELISTVSLVIWSGLEIGWGSSMFRRVVGAVVLGFTIWRLLF